MLASGGTVGDSYDNVLAKTVNGLYKAELIGSRRVWEPTEAVELVGALAEHDPVARGLHSRRDREGLH